MPILTWQCWKLHAAEWRLYLAIDAKTGCDVLQRDMVPQDRRTAIDAAALKQNFRDESYRVFVKWIPGPQHLADALTKQAGNGMLDRVMEECRWSLVETPEVRQERERQKALKRASREARESSVPAVPPVGLE